MKKNYIVFIFITLFASIITFEFNLVGTGLTLSIISFALLLSFTKNQYGINSYLFLFLVFFALYGFSAPVTFVLGDFVFMKITNFPIQAFLLQQVYAMLGMSLIIVFTKNTNLELRNIGFGFIEHNFYKIAIYLAFFSSVLELINFLRVGNFQTLFLGKAVYQSKVSSLLFTLPSKVLLEMGVLFLGLSLNKLNLRKNNKIKLIFRFVLYAAPILSLIIFLGQRGTLISIGLIFFMSYTYGVTLKKIKKSIILLIVGGYVLLTALFFFRSFFSASARMDSTSILKSRIESISENLLYFNPAYTEFGATMANFAMYYKYDNNCDYYGSTYLKGLLLPIPTFMIPFVDQKPKQITYEFRDRFFPQEADRGRIAGTGFSSILEAYMNFGKYGVLWMYAIFIFILIRLEKLKYRINSLSFVILFLAMTPITQSFHRSAFGGTIAEFSIKFILSIIIVYFSKVKIKFLLNDRIKSFLSKKAI